MHTHSTPPPKRLAIVARVSTEDQEQYGTSLPDQIAKGRLLAQLHDYSVDDAHIYSGDESGSLPLAQRPIMRRLIADAQAHRFDAVCFTKIDRIARRLTYILAVWDALDAADVAVLVIDPPLDTTTPIGRLIRNVLGSIAEFERDTIRERLMAGTRRKIAGGALFLPRGKYGYRYTRIHPHTKEPGRIGVDADEAAVVRRLYERRAAGASYERIAAELTAAAVPGPRGGQRWSYTTVRRIIRDKAYRGGARWGEGQSVALPSGKRTTHRRTDGAAPIAVAHPPIVGPDLWQAAQIPCGVPLRGAPEAFLLGGGRVRCGAHGLTMTGSHNGSGRTVYCCQRPLASGRRASHQVPGAPLDEAVWAHVGAFLRDPARGLAAAREIAVTTEQSLEEVAARRHEIAARLRRVEDEILYTLREARAAGLPASVLEASAAELGAEQRRLQEEDRSLEARAALAREDMGAGAALEQLLRDVAVGLEEATPRERRTLLETLRVQVTMDGLDYQITGCVDALCTGGTLGIRPLYRSAGLHPQGFRLRGTLPRAS